MAAVVVHEFAHFVAAKGLGMKATEAFFGFGPRIWSTQRGETEYGIKALPLGGYVRITGMNPLEEVDPAEEHRTYRGRPFWQKTVVVLAGITANFVLAWIIIYGIFTIAGVPDATRPTVASVSAEVADGVPSPSIAAGFQEGDRFVSVDGLPADDWLEIRERIGESAGQPVAVVVERNGELVTLTVTPVEVNLEGEMRGMIGITRGFEDARVDPLTALVDASEAWADQTGRVVQGVGRFLWPPNLIEIFSTAIEGEDIDPNLRPSTPVGLVTNADELQESIGYRGLLGVIASFNIIVAFFNVLPLYPLDGGHFAVALYEKVRGRPADVEKLVPVAAAVIFFFVSLFVLALWFDLFGGPLLPA